MLKKDKIIKNIDIFSNFHSFIDSRFIYIVIVLFNKILIFLLDTLQDSALCKIFIGSVINLNNFKTKAHGLKIPLYLFDFY